MANIKSAIKRVAIAERNRLRNKAYKSSVKTLTKKYFTALQGHAASPTSESMQEVQERMNEAYSKIDKAVKRGIIHRNTGARKKARMASAFKRSSESSSLAAS